MCHFDSSGDQELARHLPFTGNGHVQSVSTIFSIDPPLFFWMLCPKQFRAFLAHVFIFASFRTFYFICHYLSSSAETKKLPRSLQAVDLACNSRLREWWSSGVQAYATRTVQKAIPAIDKRIDRIAHEAGFFQSVDQRGGSDAVRPGRTRGCLRKRLRPQRAGISVRLGRVFTPSIYKEGRG